MSDGAAEDRVVDVGGVPVAVSRTGEGPAVLFVHGVYVSGHLWDEVVETTAKSHTCWVPTLPLGGHNMAVGSQWRPDLDQLVDLVPGLIEALDLDDVTVVANDTGGGLVLLALGSGHEAVQRILNSSLGRAGFLKSVLARARRIHSDAVRRPRNVGRHGSSDRRPSVH